MSWTELNRGLQKLSLETETSAEFSQVKPRITNGNIQLMYNAKLGKTEQYWPWDKPKLSKHFNK